MVVKLHIIVTMYIPVHQLVHMSLVAAVAGATVRAVVLVASTSATRLPARTRSLVPALFLYDEVERVNCECNEQEGIRTLPVSPLLNNSPIYERSEFLKNTDYSNKHGGIDLHVYYIYFFNII